MKSKNLIYLVVCFLLMAATAAFAQQIPTPWQSTTGPVPPKTAPEPRAPTKAQITIPGVPAYIWRHGCGPTAVGMVVGYWDGNGFDDFIPGDASTQTAAVNQAMASGGNAPTPPPWTPGTERHYEDYAWPMEPGLPVQPDNYITAGRPAHANDSIADFMLTSRSLRGNCYGWSFNTDLMPSFDMYAASRGPLYEVTATWYSYSLLWAALVAEIDAGRPMVFMVDVADSLGRNCLDGWPTDGDPDHFVTVIGYNAALGEYCCYDTWFQAPRWRLFQPCAPGNCFGVYEGYAFDPRIDYSGLAIKFSVDPNAIGAPGTGVNMNSGMPEPPNNPLDGDIYWGWINTNQIDIPLPLLGLQPGDDVDALAIPEMGRPDFEGADQDPHVIDPFIWHFGVDLQAGGIQGTAPDVYSEAQANQAAGDVFWATGGPGGTLWGVNHSEVSETWIGLLEQVIQTPPDEKDALDISGEPDMVGENLAPNSVFFSLDVGSPSLGQQPIGACPGDILTPDGAGGFQKVTNCDAASLGLLPGTYPSYADGDNLDALFMDTANVPVFSVAPNGASQLPPGNIYMRSFPPGGHVLLLLAGQLGLAGGDNVDALDVTASVIAGAEAEEGEGEEGEGEEGEGEEGEGEEGEGEEGEGEGEEFEFTKLPIGGWFEIGDSLTLTVEVSVQSATYHWVKDDIDINEQLNPSAITSVFEIESLLEGDDGWYACRVTYDGGKTDYLTPAVHVEVFESMPAVGLAALIAGGLVLSAIGAWGIRRRK